jgi:hypothetical protein
MRKLAVQSATLTQTGLLHANTTRRTTRRINEMTASQFRAMTVKQRKRRNINENRK